MWVNETPLPWWSQSQGGLRQWPLGVSYSVVLGPPAISGIEKYKVVIGTCIQWLWGKTMFGNSLQVKKELMAFSQMLLLTFILGGHFSLLSYPENWPNSQWLCDPGDLSTNGGEGRRGKSLPYDLEFMILPFPLGCTELFFLNLHVAPVSLLVLGQLWLLSSPLADWTCVEASRLHSEWLGSCW